jgi:uncharacterized membrane protein YeaQ/YmgE (transglycosylase-associated protein family)
MSLLLFVLFGLVIGVIAKLLMPGKDPGGFVVTAIIGMVGSVIGGLIGRAIGMYGTHQKTGGWVLSIIGAVILLGLYRLVMGRRVTRA